MSLTTKRKNLIFNIIIISILFFSSFLYLFFSFRLMIYSSIKNDIELIKDNLLTIDELPLTFSFAIDYDLENHNTTYYYDEYDLPLHKNVSNVVSAIIQDNTPDNLVQLDNKYYYYVLIPIDDEADRLIATDVTVRISMLNKLTKSLIIISLLSGIGILVISNYFTSKYLKNADDAMKKQKTFLSDASHELKTPLAIIKTNLDIMSLEIGTNKWLEVAQLEIVRMTDLINSLLFLSKSEQTNYSESKEIVNLSNVSTNVFLSLEALAFEKSIKVTTTKNYKNDVYIYGVKSQIHQLFTIIGDNAIKYCNVGGEIIVNVTKDYEYITFCVMNTGTVIKDSEKKLIFQRFYRSNPERERESLSYGLGLSLAQQICINNNAVIKAYPNKANDMTVIYVQFQLYNQ